ncbi:MAG: ABC transporter ATP-binding protein [Chloroflexota bacterium]
MKSLFRLRAFVRPYLLQIILLLAVLLAITGLSLVVPMIIQRVIDIGVTQRRMDYMLRAAGVILAIGIARAVLAYANRYLGEWIAAHIGYDLRNHLYNHIQHLPFSYHDRAQTGQLISRCIEDVRAIERFAGANLAELTRVVVLLIGITALLIANNPRLALIGVLPLIPLVLMSVNFGARIGRYFYAVDNALGDLSAHLQENVSGVQAVRAFAREPYEIERFAAANRTLFNARIGVIREWSKVMPTSNFLVALCTILLLWFGGPMVLRSEMTVGALVAFNSYILMLGGPAGQLTWLVNSVGEAVAGAKRTLEILDTVLTIRSPENAIQPAGAGQNQVCGGCVAFEDVSFVYQGETAHALSEVNLNVEPNQVVAIVGPTGSGKTSLINLIPRFYDVTAGRVLVDGHDVRCLDLTALRRQVGIVLQTSLLFSVSVRENIAYGRPAAGLEEIVAAAKAAQAHEFIQGLSDGYDTVVGERGVTLSGGQRQRVAIARALLMNPRFLILDDSTSSVDTHTERLIQQALDTLMEGRTTFVIAHRLSTVRRADLILVMDGGRIVERGRHHELLAQGGLYREIYDLQLRDQERFHEEMDALRKSPVRPLSNVGAGMKKE